MLQFIPVALAVVGIAACAKVASNAINNADLKTLAGSEWGPMDGSDRFVKFARKGELTGYGGCNQFFGQYEENGTRLIVGPLASTKKACMGDAMASETAFLRAIQNAHQFSGTRLELNLLDADGETIATFKRRDWD